MAKSTLSQLEAGVGNPSIETVWALALALDVPFSRLVDPEEAPVQVIRAGEGNVMRSDHAPFAAVLLSACPPGARRDLHVMTAEPGGARDAHAHLPGTTSTSSSRPGAGAPGRWGPRWSWGPATTPASPATGRTPTRPWNPAARRCW